MVLPDRSDSVARKTTQILDAIHDLASRVDGHDVRMNSLETRMGSLETRMQSLETRMDRGFEAVAGRIDTLIDAISDMRVAFVQHRPDD